MNIDKTLLDSLHQTAADFRARYYEIPTPDRENYPDYIRRKIEESLPEISEWSESHPKQYDYCFRLLHGTYQLAARVARENGLGNQLIEHALSLELEDLLRVGNIEGAEIFLKNHEALGDQVQAICNSLLESMKNSRQIFFLAPMKTHANLQESIENFRIRHTH